MKYTRIFILLILSTTLIFSQNEKKNIEWNGYGQFRLYKNSNTSEGFMIRRVKLWVNGQVPNAKKFTYKVSGIFTYNETGYLGLLDAYGDYNFETGYVRFGQQTPEFSLQRLQSDWKIPVVERASVINSLIPAAQSSARELGVQVHLNPVKNVWQLTAGIFNGNGANIKSHTSSNFLYTIKSKVKINFNQNYDFHIGASAMYRKSDESDFSLIFGSNNLYSGDDFRFGIETMLTLNKLEIQAEYLEANFDRETSEALELYLGELHTMLRFWKQVLSQVGK